MMFLGLIVAGFAAYWVYNDAKGFGYDNGSAAMWALGTFLLLIVVLPLYLVIGRKPQYKRREEPTIDIEGTAVEDTMLCPMCGGKVRQDYNACPYCSHTLQPKCTQCGRDLEREWRTCPYCQTPTPGK
ncbi:MAG: hypothetical protein H6Q73_4387 [Firmicutes bacterium]|nr:hypothetical protein [Bacillota bacterium]